MKNLLTFFLTLLSVGSLYIKADAQVLACNANINVSLAQDGTALLLNENLVEGSYDLSVLKSTIVDSSSNPIAGYSVSGGLQFSCSDIGQTLQYIVTDTTNNVQCWGDIMIEDKLAPVPYILSSVTVQVDTATCRVELWTTDFDVNTTGDPTSFDNCGIVSTTFGVDGYDPTPITENAQVVDLTVDHYFNANQTILGAVTGASPSLIAQYENGNIHRWNTSCDCASQYVDTGDNGSINIAVIDAAGNDAYATGTLTVTGCSGNAPAPFCRTEVNANLGVFFAPIQVFATDMIVNSASAVNAEISLDNTTWWSVIEMGCDETGSNTVYVRYSYDGQVETCTTTLNIYDIVPPVMISDIDLLIELADENDTYDLQVSEIDNGSYDNCGAVSLSLSKTTLDASDEGVNLIILTGVDASGNSNQVMSEVYVTIGPCDVDDITITWPDSVLYITDTVIAPLSVTPDYLINTLNFPEYRVRPTVDFACNQNIAQTHFDQVFNVGNRWKMLREFTVLNWLNGEVSSYVQIITNQINSEDYICDTKPRSAPVGDCSSGHTLADDVEWPNDISVNDHRITPQELVSISGIDSLDASPQLYSSPDKLYGVAYEDVLLQLSPTQIEVGRRWSIVLWNSTAGDLPIWTYVQRISIDISNFNGLVTVSDVADRGIAGVLINGAATTDESGKAVIDGMVNSIEYGSDDGDFITIRDMVMLQRHVLDIEIITDELRLSASDINNTGSVTGSDVVELRRILLGIASTPAYKFTDDTRPKLIDPLASIYGFQVGDIDQSSAFGENASVADVNLVIQDAILNAGESYEISIAINNDMDLRGLQASLEIDTDLVQVTNVESTLSGWTAHYEPGSTLQILATGALEGTALSSGDNILTLEITAKVNTLVNKFINDNSEMTLLGADMELYSAEISVENVIVGNENKILDTAISVFPNPAQDVVTFDIDSEQATILLYNTMGQLMIESDQRNIDLTSLQAGLYIYQVKTKKGQHTGQLMVAR